MIISLNWLKKFTDIDMSIDELTKIIGARLVEIENVVYLGEKYKDVLIVKVISVKKLEGSDHLNVAKIDDGGTATGVERDESGFIQVVCGAPNIRSGLLVAWLPPESIVPETFDKPEPFKLGIRNLRGTISNGMIASSRELALSDEHEGILELDDDLAPGKSFAEAYELDDYLLDIENKSLTHRPDCFGIIGFAREVAAISGKEFKTPDWLMKMSVDFDIDTKQVELNAVIDDPKLCPRYMAVVLSDANGDKKSPLQVQTYLSRVGMRPINAIVDVTNYLMLLTGQPLHAFDYDKLISLNDNKAEIHVRSGHDKEKLDLLDGRTIELSLEDIVITSGETAIGLAGAMGGASTVIDSNTRRIIIESATFNLYKLRSTQMRHGIFSEAITRFTKGQPAELAASVLSAAIQSMGKWADAKPMSAIVDMYPDKISQPAIKVSGSLVNSVLGTNIELSQMSKIIGNAEFDVEIDNSNGLIIKSPYWRSDVHIDEDIIEEIGRLSGFDNIEPTLPTRNFTAVKQSDFDDFRNKIRKILARAGANEVLTYSFIHGDVLKKSGQDIKNSYRITNSISPDLQYYRQTLTPSLIGLIHPNIRQGYDSFAIFEMNKTHQKSDGLTAENVPVENDMLSLIVANKDKQIGETYYQAKRLLDYLGDLLGLKLSYEQLNDEPGNALTVPFEYRRGAQVTDSATGLLIGVVGEFKKSVSRSFKLSEFTAGFEINVRQLFEATQNLANSYKPISRYPSAERDICFQVSSDVRYDQIIKSASLALINTQLETYILPIDIYQPEKVETKNITIRIKITSHDHTLSSEEIVKVIEGVEASVITETHATVI